MTKAEGHLRWTAVANYRSQLGIVDVYHEFEELHELHEIIEQGPNFYALENIVITLTKPIPEITLENPNGDPSTGDDE